MIALQDCEALLIGCGAGKQPTAVRAAELYTSTYFKEKVRFAEAMGLPWAILSAKYGILKPDTITEPYDLTAEVLTPEEKREWVAGVALQLFEWEIFGDGFIISLRSVRHIAIIAGETYVKPLTETLRTLGVEVLNPCAGLGIGQQIAWLRAHHTTTWLSRPYTKRDGRWFDEWGDAHDNPAKREMFNQRAASAAHLITTK